MDYVIKNNRNLYIKLDKNGTPVSCLEKERALFEYSKAKNILKGLPKSLQKFGFKVVPIPDIMPVINKQVVNIIKEKAIESNDYELSDNISRWVEKFGMCSDVFSEAKQSLQELQTALDNFDKELLDILHIIELEPSKDLYRGWKLYKRIRENRRGRRAAKDEILIIENVIKEIDPKYLERKNIQKSIDGLFKRKYKFRIVEIEEEAEDAM